MKNENREYHVRKHASQKVPGPPFFRGPPLFDQAPPFKENFPGPVPSALPNFGQPPPFKRGGAGTMAMIPLRSKMLTNHCQHGEYCSCYLFC